MKVVCNIDAGKILRRRGLQPDGPVQRMFTQECAKAMDRYVPMSSAAGGHFKNRISIGPNYVMYPGPYAHYQYHGVLYLARNGSSWAKKGERKYPSGRELTYHGTPTRGKQWDVRMWNDNKRRLMQLVAKACGGRAK